jgi:hypothetical protein
MQRLLCARRALCLRQGSFPPRTPLNSSDVGSTVSLSVHIYLYINQINTICGWLIPLSSLNSPVTLSFSSFWWIAPPIGFDPVEMVNGNSFHYRKHSWPAEDFVGRTALQLVSPFHVFPPRSVANFSVLACIVLVVPGADTDAPCWVLCSWISMAGRHRSRRGGGSSTATPTYSRSLASPSWRQ